MIKCLSPYYVTIPLVDPVTAETCTSYTLNIYVWDGDISSIPVTPSYAQTKLNPTASTGNDKINIARLINDYIDFMPAEGSGTGILDAANQRWVYLGIVYTVPIDGVGTEQEFLAATLMVKGYSYGMDGENATTPANRILMSGTEFKVNRTGVFNVPVKILDT
jgi:hypothetical protein